MWYKVGEERVEKLFSGRAGEYEYCTTEDLLEIINDAQELKDPWFHLKIKLLDVASLTQRYASILNNYERRFVDDGK